jgi:hypothetical protein
MMSDKLGKGLISVGKKKLAPGHDRWPRCKGDYVEKYWDNSTIKYELVLV